MSRTPWSRPALNALELLYTSGWLLEAIALHCGAIDGCERTRGAIFAKARAIGLKQGRIGGRYRARGDRYDDDLREMMSLDFSQSRMARELQAQHRLPFSQAWVVRRMDRIGGPEVAAWRRRASKRRSEVMLKRNARERALRRAAA
ncbi:MAG: hypothetical protein R3215_11105 [Halomonas sp.]|nr:hypothetical protein [Halomonas sp.]